MVSPPGLRLTVVEHQFSLGTEAAEEVPDRLIWGRRERLTDVDKLVQQKETRQSQSEGIGKGICIIAWAVKAVFLTQEVFKNVRYVEQVKHDTLSNWS